MTKNEFDVELRRLQLSLNLPQFWSPTTNGKGLRNLALGLRYVVRTCRSRIFGDAEPNEEIMKPEAWPKQTALNNESTE